MTFQPQLSADQRIAVKRAEGTSVAEQTRAPEGYTGPPKAKASSSSARRRRARAARERQERKEREAEQRQLAATPTRGETFLPPKVEGRTPSLGSPTVGLSVVRKEVTDKLEQFFDQQGSVIGAAYRDAKAGGALVPAAFPRGVPLDEAKERKALTELEEDIAINAKDPNPDLGPFGVGGLLGLGVLAHTTGFVSGVTGGVLAELKEGAVHGTTETGLFTHSVEDKDIRRDVALEKAALRGDPVARALLGQPQGAGGSPYAETERAQLADERAFAVERREDDGGKRYQPTAPHQGALHVEDHSSFIIQPPQVDGQPPSRAGGLLASAMGGVSGAFAGFKARAKGAKKPKVPKAPATPVVGLSDPLSPLSPPVNEVPSMASTFEIGGGGLVPSGAFESVKSSIANMSPATGALLGAGAGLAGGALIGATVAEIGSQPRTSAAPRRSSTRKRSSSRKKTARRKTTRKTMRRVKKGKGKARGPKRYTREDRSGVVRAKKTYRGKRVHYTKNGQPYVYQANGRVRFVPR